MKELLTSLFLMISFFLIGQSPIFFKTNFSDEKIMSFTLSETFFNEIPCVSNRKNVLKSRDPFQCKQRLDSVIFKDFYIQDSSFENSFKYEFFYDSLGRQKRILISLWDFIYPDKWYKHIWQDYLFDQNNQLIESYFFNEVSQPMDTVNICYYYYQDGLCVKKLYFQKCGDSIWVKSHKDIFVYDELNLLKEKIRSNFNKETKSWEKESKNIYEYSSSLLLLRDTRLKWESNEWNKDTKTEYHFDELLNLDNKYYANWIDGMWEFYNRSDFLFDYNSKSEYIIYPSWDFQFYAYHKPLMIKNFKIANLVSSGYLDYIGEYYYSDLATSLKAVISKEDLIVYPNPVKNKLHFHHKISGQFTILTETGNCIFSSELNELEFLNIKDFKPGLYFYILYNRQSISTGSFIKS